MELVAWIPNVSRTGGRLLAEIGLSLEELLGIGTGVFVGDASKSVLEKTVLVGVTSTELDEVISTTFEDERPRVLDGVTSTELDRVA